MERVPLEMVEVGANGLTRSSGCPPDLPEDLRNLVENARGSGARASAAAAEQAYDLAVLARAATGRHTQSGMTAIEACARELSLARSTLHAFAILAIRLMPSELMALLERSDAGGRSLSISHLLLIARLPRDDRQRWIQRVLAEGLGVGQLKRLIRAAAWPSPEGPTTTEDARKSR